MAPEVHARILELAQDSSLTQSAIAAIVNKEFHLTISQPTVSIICMKHGVRRKARITGDRHRSISRRKPKFARKTAPHKKSGKSVKPVLDPIEKPRSEAMIWDATTEKLRSGKTPFPEEILAVLDRLEDDPELTVAEASITSGIDFDDLLYYLYHYDPYRLDELLRRKESYEPGQRAPWSRSSDHSILYKSPKPSHWHPVGGGYQRGQEVTVDYDVEPDIGCMAPRQRGGLAPSHWQDLNVLLSEEEEARIIELCANTNITQKEIAEIIKKEFGIRLAQSEISVFCRERGIERRTGPKPKRSSKPRRYEPREPKAKRPGRQTESWLSKEIKTQLAMWCDDHRLTHKQILDLLKEKFGIHKNHDWVSRFCRNIGKPRKRGRKPKLVMPPAQPPTFEEFLNKADKLELLRRNPFRRNY